VLFLAKNLRTLFSARLGKCTATTIDAAVSALPPRRLPLVSQHGRPLLCFLQDSTVFSIPSLNNLVYDMADGTQFMIQDAGSQLQETVTKDEASVFHHTTLGDIQQALQVIEDEQAKRMSLTNLRRIEPFLSWMKDYSGILDTLCQGFSPMVWVWVFISCFEELLNNGL
jgi:hypothetical protein